MAKIHVKIRGKARKKYFVVRGRVGERHREFGAKTREEAETIRLRIEYIIALEKLERLHLPRGATVTGKPSGRVYFVQAVSGGLVKIGFTDGPAKIRLLGLQSMSPVPLRILFSMPGTIDDEQALHAQFAAIRRHGEWFDPAPELFAFIRERRSKRHRGPQRRNPLPALPSAVPA